MFNNRVKQGGKDKEQKNTVQIFGDFFVVIMFPLWRLTLISLL